MRRVFRLSLPRSRSRVASEVDDELKFHLEMRTQQLVARGWTPADARAEALRQFGDVRHVRDDCVTLDQERERAMRRANMLAELRQDVVYALRTFRRNPGFTLIVVLTLALGVGTNTAIFTLVNAVMLRTLPVEDPQRLVAIGDPARVNSVSEGSLRTDMMSYGQYGDVVAGTSSVFSGVLASGRGGRLEVIATAGAGPERPRARFVSPNYFNVLGVRLVQGRGFDVRASGNAAIGSSPVVVISYNWWMRRLDGARDVIGRTIVVNGTRLTIVGVASPEFTGEIVGTMYDLWIPLEMQQVLQPNQPLLQSRVESWLLLLGRLRPGVTFAQARERVGAVIRHGLVEHAIPTEPTTEAEAQRAPIHVSSGAKGFSRVRNTYAVPLLTLTVCVGLLLLIICANVATLLLARAITRSREMSVRLAIGAGRMRIVRQLLTESLLLAFLGAMAGLGLAWAGSRVLLTRALGAGAPNSVDIGMDLPVLGFTMALAALAVVLFGLAPALRASRVDVAMSMRTQGRGVSGALGGTGGRIPIGKMLIAAQVALSLVLLSGAALLVRSLRSVEDADTGMDRDHILMVDVDNIARGYKEERNANLARELTARFARMPNVAAVSFSSNGIFSGTESEETIVVPGFTAASSADSASLSDDVGPGYVRAIGGKLLQGRDIDARDVVGASPVLLVNRSFAEHFFPHASPIGRTVRILGTIVTKEPQIVGVLTDTKDHDLHAPPAPRMYMAYAQRLLYDPGSLRFEIRTSGNPTDVVALVRQEINAVDPQLQIVSIAPLSLLMHDSIREQRLVATLATWFGALALLLAAIGLYGVMAYAVARRTGEIGLRMALGASAGDVVRLVVFDALRVVGVGLVFGAPLAVIGSQLLKSQLHGVSAYDPLSLASALMVLLTTAALAALLPAKRASRVMPSVALSQE